MKRRLIGLIAVALMPGAWTQAQSAEPVGILQLQAGEPGEVVRRITGQLNAVLTFNAGEGLTLKTIPRPAGPHYCRVDALYPQLDPPLPRRPGLSDTETPRRVVGFESAMFFAPRREGQGCAGPPSDLGRFFSAPSEAVAIRGRYVLEIAIKQAARAGFPMDCAEPRSRCWQQIAQANLDHLQSVSLCGAETSEGVFQQCYEFGLGNQAFRIFAPISGLDPKIARAQVLLVPVE